MITGAGGSSKHCWKELGVAGSSIETWNTGWTALIVSGRRSVNDCGLSWAIISYGLRYFSESFFDGRVVQKYCNLTNTDCPAWKSGGCCQWESVEGLYCLWALAISSLSVLCSSSRSITKSQAREEAISCSGVTPLENFLWKCSMGYNLYPWISLLEFTLETSYKPQT